MIPLGADDLVLTASSIGAPPFATLLAAARAGGFAGVSLGSSPQHGAADDATTSLTVRRKMLDDHGLVVQDVDAIIVWAGANDPGPPYLGSSNSDAICETALALGAKQVNAIVLGERGVSIAELSGAIAFARDVAVSFGLRVAFEFARASALRTVADAVAAFAMVEHRYGDSDSEAFAVGLTVDAWQMHWEPSNLEALAHVDGARVHCVQLDDAPAARPPDLLRATYDGRLIPGEGAANLVGLIRTLDAIGYRGPLTVETINAELIASHDPVVLARKLGDATRAVIAMARA